MGRLASGLTRRVLAAKQADKLRDCQHNQSDGKDRADDVGKCAAEAEQRPAKHVALGAGRTRSSRARISRRLCWICRLIGIVSRLVGVGRRSRARGLTTDPGRLAAERAATARGLGLGIRDHYGCGTGRHQ